MISMAMKRYFAMADAERHAVMLAAVKVCVRKSAACSCVCAVCVCMCVSARDRALMIATQDNKREQVKREWNEKRGLHTGLSGIGWKNTKPGGQSWLLLCKQEAERGWEGKERTGKSGRGRGRGRMPCQLQH